MDHPAASHRLSIGVPATIEHASTSNPQSGSERAKRVAECTQSFITFMDALKLKLRAKDQLHPLLSEVISGWDKSGGSGNASDGAEGRGKLLGW